MQNQKTGCAIRQFDGVQQNGDAMIIGEVYWTITLLESYQTDIKQNGGGVSMETNLGAGQNFMRDFTADFAESEIYMGGKIFPKGHFTVAVLNHGKELRTKLLCFGLPLRDAFKQLEDRMFTEEVYDKAVAAVWEIQKELSKVEPFCYLDMEQEADLLDAVLSEDSKQTMTDCFQIAANHFYTNDPSSIHLSTEEKTTLDKGLYIHDCLKRIFNSYSYFCHDLVNFCTAVVNLEASELRNLEQRKESDFAKACHRYFSQPEVMLALYLTQPSVGVAGFALSANVSMQMTVIPDPKQDGDMIIARRFRFCRIMDFLIMDFFEGLHAGHSPRQCEICSRFFLMLNGRLQKYCDGYAPNDPKHRTCRQVGNRMGREAREKSKDHPAKAIYQRRCNTIDHHLRDGKISKPFSIAAKKIAKEKMNLAIKNNVYFTTRYEQEMTQEAIYAETEKQLLCITTT